MTIEIAKEFGRLAEQMNELGKRIDNLYGSLHQENANKIEAITPYTETKTAYIGDTEITFYDIPSKGNVTVYLDREYEMERYSDRLVLTFAPLTDITDITISIL